MKIKLLQEQIDLLVNLPETGMGYHIVDIKLKNGRMLHGKIVLNSTYLQMDDKEEIDPNEIEAIKLHKK
jgi:small nuclear ribonucleoprotein (snRNP)-like protein